MKRCLNGRKVAFNRSKEITAMLVREVRTSQEKRKTIIILSFGVKNIFTMAHLALSKIVKVKDITPTNMSATVKFITKYMARVRRLLFFIKTMIDRKFTITIATDSVRNTANQVMHSEGDILDSFLFASNFKRSPVSLCCSTSAFGMNLNKVKLVREGEQIRVRSIP